MFPILGLQGGGRRRAQTREAADVATQAGLQRRHRIGNAAGSVQPTFQRGDAKVEIETGQGMPPDLGGERRQGCVQGTGFRWRG